MNLNQQAEFDGLINGVRDSNYAWYKLYPPEGQFHLQRPAVNNDKSGWLVTKINTAGIFYGNPNSVMMKYSKVRPGISIFDCVPEDKHADLLALLISSVTVVNKFTTDVTINLLNADETSSCHRMDQLNVSPICNSSGDVTGVVFAKCRAYGSCLEDKSVRYILEQIHEKVYVSWDNNAKADDDPVLALYSYTTAKQYLTDLGHSPSLYMGENDNEEFFDTTCNKSWIRYMLHYAVMIINWKQQACYWSDTVMPAADRLHCGSGAYQSDHIQSMINGQADDSNRLFFYVVNEAQRRRLIILLTEGAKTALAYHYYHAILSKETRITLRQVIPVGRYVAAAEIKLPVEVLDDAATRPFIVEYRRLWGNPAAVTPAKLKAFTMLVNIDVEDVAYFSLDKWDTFKKTKKRKITQIFYNTIIRLCGGCIHCFWMESTDAYYFERFQMHMLPVLGLPRCDYHHINEDRKLFNISQSDKDNKSPTELLSELRKVVCLCCRHHKYITNNRPTPEGANAQEILDRFLLSRNYHADEHTGVLTPNEDDEE
jgi:hypothetical protein